MSEPRSIQNSGTSFSRTSAERAVNKVPGGNRIHFEDDLIEVYNEKGERVESGLYDYSVYRREERKWNEKDQNYDLPHGYKMVGLTKH